MPAGHNMALLNCGPHCLIAIAANILMRQQTHAVRLCLWTSTMYNSRNACMLDLTHFVQMLASAGNTWVQATVSATACRSQA
jgi:hypothetical protein